MPELIESNEVGCREAAKAHSISLVERSGEWRIVQQQQRIVAPES